MTEIANSTTTAASQRWALFSGASFHLPGVLANEAYRGSHLFTLPAFPLPVTSGWIVGPWASSRASHPAVTSDACQERGRALSTHSELTVDHSRPSISVISLTPVRPHVAPRSAGIGGRGPSRGRWPVCGSGGAVVRRGPGPAVRGSSAARLAGRAGRSTRRRRRCLRVRRPARSPRSRHRSGSAAMASISRSVHDQPAENSQLRPLTWPPAAMCSSSSWENPAPSRRTSIRRR